MKTIILRLYALIALTSILICSCEKKKSVIENNKYATNEFIAQMPSLELFNCNATYTNTLKTKTITKDGNKVIWCEGDKVSILNGQNINEEFIVKKGFGGKTTTTLQKVESSDFPAGSGDTFDANIAYYPHGNIAYCGTENNHSLEVTIPDSQTYYSNSFGSGSLPMVAVTTSKTDNTLSFKNIFGMLKLQLKSSPYVCKVKSITIKGNNKEKLSGEAILKCSNTEDPTISFVEAEANDYIKLDCGEGVELNHNTVTEFWITLPPITFYNGITASIELTDGTVVDKSSKSALTITRSVVKPMSVLTVNTEYLEQKSSIIIKEFYYTGCINPETEKNYTLRDTYFSLYNNSGNIAYLDSLCVGVAFPYNAHLNGGLSDWVKPGTSELRDSIPAASMSWMFNGTGKSIAIQPGEEVIVCLNAINHIPICSTSIDLSNSSYYALYDAANTPAQSAPAPGVKTLECFWKTGTSRAFVVSISSPALYIYTMGGKSKEQFILDTKTVNPNSPGNRDNDVLLIDKNLIVDGVECLISTSQTKRLRPEIDNGSVIIKEGGGAGKSVHRKIDAEATAAAGGRIVYQDTNNSSNDFEVRDIPTLKK